MRWLGGRAWLAGWRAPFRTRASRCDESDELETPRQANRQYLERFKKLLIVLTARAAAPYARGIVTHALRSFMEKSSKFPPGPAAPTPAFATALALDAIDARSLLKGRKEALLLLDGEPYRLRITGNNKLILTK